MNKPKMILFDYGNTLVYEPDWDYMNGENAVFKHIISNPYNKTPEQLNDFAIELFGTYEKCRNYGFEPASVQSLKYKYDYFNIEFDIDLEKIQQILWDNTSQSVPMPYMKELLEYLKKNNIRTGVISNTGWSGNVMKKRLDNVFPNNAFDFVIASSDYAFRKPSKMLFDLAASKACLNTDDIWYCGDDVGCDVSGAYNAGIFPVLYENDKAKSSPYSKAADITDIRFEFLHIHSWLELIEVLKECK